MCMHVVVHVVTTSLSCACSVVHVTVGKGVSACLGYYNIMYVFIHSDTDVYVYVHVCV